MQTLEEVDQSFVFFIDNADTLMSGRHDETKRSFMNFIENIMKKSPNIKVIITCRDEVNQTTSSEMQLEVPGLH
jgi:hypothetical protein